MSEYISTDPNFGINSPSDGYISTDPNFGMDLKETEPKKESGDFMRGAGEAFQQVPQLGYGLVAGAGVVAEKAFGEGGISTGIKKAGVEGYQRWGEKVSEGAKETDSWSISYERAKEGDFASLVDWFQHGLGYAASQGVQILATGVLGGLAAKGAGVGAIKMAEGMVAKESAKIAATKEGAALSADQIAKMATANVASKIGQNTALAATAFGMEGGEIYGDLVSEASKTGRELSGSDLGKAFVATAAAGGLEFIGDKLGLDLMLGKKVLGISIPSGRAARGLTGATTGIVGEGLTEYGQTLIEEAGKGKDPFSPESLRNALDAAALGALGGGAMGGVGGVISKPQPKDPIKETLDTMPATSADAEIEKFNQDLGLSEVDTEALLRNITESDLISKQAAQEAAQAIQTQEPTQPPIQEAINVIPEATANIQPDQSGELSDGVEIRHATGASAGIKSGMGRPAAVDGGIVAAGAQPDGVPEGEPAQPIAEERQQEIQRGTGEGGGYIQQPAPEQPGIEQAGRIDKREEEITKGERYGLQKKETKAAEAVTTEKPLKQLQSAETITTKLGEQQTDLTEKIEQAKPEVYTKPAKGTIKVLSDGRYAAIGFTPEQIKSADPSAFIDGKGNGIFPSKTNKIQLERALGISTFPRDAILAEGDKPYKNQTSALIDRKARGLNKTHIAQRIEGGFALVPKESKTEKKAEDENPNKATYSTFQDGKMIRVSASGVSPAMFGAKFEKQAKEYYEGLKSADNPKAFAEEWSQKIKTESAVKPIETEQPIPAKIAEGAISEKPEKIKQAEQHAILERANVTGKDRLDIMRDFREGKHSLEDLEKAYQPPKEPKTDQVSGDHALYSKATLPTNEFWRKIKSGETFTEKELNDAYSIGRRGTSRAGESESKTGSYDLQEAAREVFHWGGTIAGFEKYRTSGEQVKDGRFIVSVTPEELADTAEGGSILEYAFTKTDDGKYRLDLIDPLPGSVAHNALMINGAVEELEQIAEDGINYQRVKLRDRYSTSRTLIQEAIRRLALHIGEVPTIVQAARETGARAGNAVQREFNAETIEAKFSQSASVARNPHTLSTLRTAINSAFSHVKDFAGLLESTGKVHFISNAQIGEYLGDGSAFSKENELLGYLDGEEYRPNQAALTDAEKTIVVDAFNKRVPTENKVEKVWQVEESGNIEATSEALQSLATSSGYEFHRDSRGEKYFWIRNKENGATFNVRISDHARVNAGQHFKTSDINIAPEDGEHAVDNFASALWKMRNATVNDDGDTVVAGKETVRFSKAKDQTDTPAFKTTFQGTEDERWKVVKKLQEEMRKTTEWKKLSADMQKAQTEDADVWRNVIKEARRLFEEKVKGTNVFAAMEEKVINDTAMLVFGKQARENVPNVDASWMAEKALHDFQEKYIDERVLPSGEFIEQANQKRSYYTSTPFKSWFNGSKVINKDGAPLVAFHVTSRDFSVFNTSAGVRPGRMKSTAAYSGMLGTWFTAPSFYAGNYDIGGAEAAVEHFAEEENGDFKEGAQVMPVHLSIKNPMEYESFEEMLDDRDGFKDIGAYKQSLIVKGYDGIVVRNSDTDGFTDRDDWVAFNPTQIKSAIGNIGTFDPRNPDIRYSKDGRILAFVKDGHTYFVFDNISSTDDNVKGLAMHEVALHALQLGRTDAEFQKILQQIETLRKMGNKKVQAARDRVPADTAQDLILEEQAGYLIEQNSDMPIVQKLIARFRALLRMVGNKLPMAQRMQWFKWANELTLDDIVLMAQDAMKSAPGALKTAGARGTFLAGASDKLYSQLRVAVRDMNDKIFQGSGANVNLHLMNNLGKYGIKKDEIFWTGLSEFLTITPKVSKSDVLNFLDQNGVQVQDVVLGNDTRKLDYEEIESNDEGFSEMYEAEFEMKVGGKEKVGIAYAPGADGWWAFYRGEIVAEDVSEVDAKSAALEAARDDMADTEPGATDTKFAAHQLPGGRDYRELLITLPAKTPAHELRSIAQMKEFLAQNRPLADSLEGMTDVEKLKALNKKLAKEGATPTFTSSHYPDHPNLIAHVRMDTRDDAMGRTGTFLEEQQSDWGIKASKDGFNIAQIMPDGTKRTPTTGVPPAPFVTSSTGKGSTAHTLLSLKKTILYAIEQGHEFVSWTTGSQQKDRYSLSKQISRVEVSRPQDGSYAVYVYEKKNDTVPLQQTKVTTEAELSDYIGKDLAAKIVKQPIGTKKDYTGLDLDIGGEWADSLYGDKNGLDANGKPSLMSQAVKEVARQLGIELKVEPITLPGKERDAGTGWASTGEDVTGRKETKQPGFTITPELRSKVTSAGMPLFSKRQQAIPGTAQSKTRIVGDAGRQYTPEQRAAMARTGSVVTEKSTKETLQTLWQGAGKKLAQGIVDQFRPIRDLDDHAYTLMRLSKGATGAFEAFMQYGKLSIKDGAFDADTSGGVLEKVFFQLGKESTDFLRWVAGNRAERLKAAGLERLFTDADIAAFKSLADGKTDFDYIMPDGTVTRDRTLIYRDSLKKFNEFNKNVLDMAEQSSLIDGASRKLWEHEFYVPFYRTAAEEDGGVRGMNIKSGVIRQQAFQKLKGGEQQLNDLLENTLMNWAHMIDASAKNRAAMATLKAAEKVGAARKAEPGEKKTVWFMDNGKKAEYKVEDPYLMEAISSLEYAGLRGPSMDAMSTMKHWLTVGITASPFFKVRNLIRDSIQSIATASKSDLSYNPLSNVKTGFKLTDRKNAAQEYVSALAGGGLIRFGTMLEGSEAKRTRQLIKQGANDSHILDDEGKIRAFYDKYIEPGITAYNELGNRGEEINRMSLYDTLTKNGMDHATASLMARDLMDFSMQGTWTSIRFLTQIVPFMNARLQGLYKLGRAAKDDKARFAIVLGSTAMASLALLAAYGDDDDWKQREDWDRDNYWWFKIGREAFRIPKPFEIGAIATMAERAAELVFDKEMTGKRFASLSLGLAGSQLAMNPVPQLFKPIIDLYANKDSFTGRDIESMGMERLAPEYRFKQGTSMVARGLSTAGNIMTGENFLSPVQIDHITRAYFGWLGSFVVGSADLMIRGLSNEPTKPALDYWKVATGGMVSGLEGAQSRYVSQMYDQAKELEKAYGTWRNLIKEGKTEEAKEYRESNKEKLERYRRVENIKKQSSKINEHIRMVERGNLNSEEKRIKINELRKQQDILARKLVLP